MTRKASLPLQLQKKERRHKLSTVRMTFYCLQREVEEGIWQLRLLGWLHRPKIKGEGVSTPGMSLLNLGSALLLGALCPGA